jgi:hypothetical protein
MIEHIVEFEDVIDCGPDGVTVTEAVFKKEFGPWKKGQKLDCLSLEGDELTEWSSGGEVMLKCKVMMVPFHE